MRLLGMIVVLRVLSLCWNLIEAGLKGFEAVGA